VSARAWLRRSGRGDLRGLEREERFAAVQALAGELMQGVAAVVPVLPVPLVARVLLQASAPITLLELKAACQREMESLRARNARLYLPRGDEDYAIEVGLRMLTLRRLATETDGLYAANAQEEALLRYYANSIAHLG